jgi:anthranilate/para-aminobenzoate synthase component II
MFLLEILDFKTGAITQDCLDDEGEILSMRHKTKPINGIQYHPESILSPQGSAILKNWLRL